MCCTNFHKQLDHKKDLHDPQLVGEHALFLDNVIKGDMEKDDLTSSLQDNILVRNRVLQVG